MSNLSFFSHVSNNIESTTPTMLQAAATRSDRHNINHRHHFRYSQGETKEAQHNYNT